MKSKGVSHKDVFKAIFTGCFCVFCSIQRALFASCCLQNFLLQEVEKITFVCLLFMDILTCLWRICLHRTWECPHAQQISNIKIKCTNVDNDSFPGTQKYRMDGITLVFSRNSNDVSSEWKMTRYLSWRSSKQINKISWILSGELRVPCYKKTYIMNCLLYVNLPVYYVRRLNQHSSI